MPNQIYYDILQFSFFPEEDARAYTKITGKPIAEASVHELRGLHLLLGIVDGIKDNEDLLGLSALEQATQQYESDIVSIAHAMLDFAKS